MNCLASLAFFAVLAAAYAAPSDILLSGAPAVVSSYAADHAFLHGYGAPIVSAYSAGLASPYSFPYHHAYSAYSAPVVSAYSAPVVANGVVGHSSVDTVVAGPSGTISTSRSGPAVVGAHGLYV